MARAIVAALDGRPIRDLDLSEARTLDEAAEMAANAVVASIAGDGRGDRLVTVRWGDGRIASRRVRA